MIDERSSGESVNPYASPQAPYEFPPVEGSRSGPRWEQPGPFWSRFFGTIKDCMGRNCVRFFREMRREGGWLAPLSFCVTAMLLFGLGSFLFWDLWLGGTDSKTALIYVVGLAIAAPVLTILQLALCSLLHHGALTLLGGAPCPFEATFRVVAYASGCAMPFVLVPGNLGSFANLSVTMIFTGVGLCQAHEISKAKATAATLLPLAFCLASGLLVIWQMEAHGVLDWLSEMEADE